MYSSVLFFKKPNLLKQIQLLPFKLVTVPSSLVEILICHWLDAGWPFLECISVHSGIVYKPFEMKWLNHQVFEKCFLDILIGRKE